MSHGSPCVYAASRATMPIKLIPDRCNCSATLSYRERNSGFRIMDAEALNPGMLNVLLGATKVTVCSAAFFDTEAKGVCLNPL